MSKSLSPLPPLAERLRPKTLGDVIGQAHILGPGMALRLAFESGQPHSCILWGPPGTGKTTIARLMADAFDAQFITISAETICCEELPLFAALIANLSLSTTSLWPTRESKTLIISSLIFR